MAKILAGCLDQVVFLQAIFPFAGSNEDELSFNKNDVFVVTKKDDGGWWEGTLDGKIGWFPNNYVKEISAEPEPTPSEIPSLASSEEATSYHSQVVDSLIQAQNKHLDELKAFLENYLTKLKTTKNILNQQDRDVIASNYNEIVDFHVDLAKKLIEQQEKPIPEQRFGECFLNLSKQMKELYLTYCNNHPQAAALVQQHGEVLGEYMEGLGAAEPGIMHLTPMLSKPFLHVEKYGNQIKELERHVLENHIDKLDMKKATQVLQIIALSCNEVRKKKEMELQMLTGKIDGWQGDPISSLGTLVHMGQVFLEKEDVTRRERYFCLFPNDLVVLSVSPELVGYCFEERHLVSEITAKDVEDSDTFFNGFQLIVSESLWQVMTSSPREKDAWTDALKKALDDKFVELAPPTPVVQEIKRTGSNLERSDSKRSEVRSAPVLDHNTDNSSFMRSYSTGATLTEKTNRSANSSPIHDKEPYRRETLSAVRGSVRQPVKKEWSFTRLRPTPPYQQNSHLKSNDTSESPRAMRRIVSAKNKMIGGKGSREELMSDISRKGSIPASLHSSSSQQILEEDMMILSVIEAYCFSTRQRQTMNSPISPGRNYSPDLTDASKLPAIEEMILPSLHNDGVESSPLQEFEDDVIDSDDELIPIRTKSFGKKILVKGGSPDSPFLAPDVPPHFSFKPITPPRQTQTSGKQKSLKKFKKKPDTNAELDGLKQQVQNLHKQTLYLRENLEEERKARENFERFFKRVIQHVSPDVDLTEEKMPAKSTPI